MKTNTHTLRQPLHVSAAERHSLLTGLNEWIKNQAPTWEENRIGITATAIFLQVTAAAIMICIAGMAGASPLAFGAGILFAFLADSLAFAQAPMRWVIGIMVASIIVNISLAIYFGTQLL